MLHKQISYFGKYGLYSLLIAFFLIATVNIAVAQEISPEIYKNLEYRHIGPEGNRVTAIVGQPGNPDLIYVGAASGGIWKTENGGISWKPVFDDQDVSSIGSLALSLSDPNIIWAGSGEANIRSSISIGNGIYKSTDAGNTWRHMGLRNTGRIGRVIIDPHNPDIVFAAALGHSYGPQKERGVYRTIDGGETWDRILFTDENTGASEIAMDPSNSRNLIAGMWPLEIKTWQRTSGGPHGGLFKSRDGGATWEKLTIGLPEPPTGNIAVAYAPSNPNRVYALIETNQYEFKGVLWGSEDGGDTWDLISYDQQYHTRPHYYTQLVVAPDNELDVWFLATRMARTLDGGKTHHIVSGVGGDNHDIWIDPHDPDRILVANDGGVSISLNDGKNWRRPDLPVAQMYHVSVDKAIPYYVYGNQQDGPTHRISYDGSSDHGVGGGEAGFTFADPFDGNIIWASNEQGVLTRYDLRSHVSTNVQVWPETPVGRSPRDIKYRWVWSYPWILSSHTQNTLYAGSQYVHKTTNGGKTWTVISPDLTTNDPEMQVHSGGLTYDNVGVDYGTTLYAIAESPLSANLLYVGTNDGLIHVTRDGGETWTNITKNFPNLLPLGTVTSIDASRYNEGTAYITIDFHQVNNRNPYVYKTENYGNLWKLITNGIPKSVMSYAQIVREDPQREGLLYLGTENAIYVSFDDGSNWMSLRNNLPPAPVRWLDIQDHFNDLVIGTYGRGYWIMDDITPLRQLNKSVLESNAHLFVLRPAYRFHRSRRRRGGSPYTESAQYGAFINYYLEQESSQVEIVILDDSGAEVKKFGGSGQQGINRAYWGLRHEDSPTIKLRTPAFGHPGVAVGPENMRYNAEGWRRLSVEGSGPNGPLAAPGKYTVKLTVDGVEYTRELEVRKDPKTDATNDDIREQVRLALEIKDKVTVLTNMTNSIEWIRKQIDDLEDYVKGHGGYEKVAAAAAELDQKFVDVEDNLIVIYTTGATENLLRFPQQLFSHFKMLGRYVMSGDARPTDSKYEVYNELSLRLETYLKQFNNLVNRDLVQFNKMLISKKLSTISEPLLE